MTGGRRRPPGVPGPREAPVRGKVSSRPDGPGAAPGPPASRLILAGIVLVVAVAGMQWLGFDDLSRPQADDPPYQESATRFELSHLLTHPQGSPAYVGWYRALMVLAGRGPALTIWNNLLLGVALAVLVFLYVCRLKAGLPAALAAGLTVAWSRQNLGCWPKVSHLAIVIVMTGLVASTAARSLSRQLQIVAGALLLASFARPELVAGFALALAASLAARRVERPPWEARRIGVIVGCLAAAAVVALVIGLPRKGQSLRSGVAFRQHFAVNWFTWEESSRNPWLEHEVAWREAFGDAEGYLQAWRRNPGAMARHVGDNSVRTAILPLVVAFVPATATLPVVPVLLLRPGLGVGYLLAAAFCVVVARAFSDPETRRVNERPLFFEAAKLAVVCAPVVLSCIAIYPRYHYMAFLSFSLVGIGFAVIGLGWGRRRWAAPACGGYALLLLVLALTA